MVIENNRCGVISYYCFENEDGVKYCQAFGHYMIKNNNKEVEND